MSFQDDIAADLSAVFFEDFKHIALIGGQEFKGFLDKEPRRFYDVDINQKIFTASADNFPKLNRREVIKIDNVEYNYVRSWFDGQKIIIVLI